MTDHGGNKYGGKKYGGAKYGGHKAGGNKYGGRKTKKSIFERGLEAVSGSVAEIEQIGKKASMNGRKAAAKTQTKAAPAKTAPAKTASKSAPATETRTSGRDNKPGRENQNPEGKPKQQERITTAKTKSTSEAKKPDAAKQTQTDRNNKASAARRKQRRKSSNSKYNEGPGGKFNFAGAVSRQLTGR